jgi:hypothetical protein
MHAGQRKSASRSRTFLKLPSWARRTNPSTLTQIRQLWRQAAVEPEGNNLNGLKDVRTENGSSEGQNLAVTGLGVPNSLDTGGLEDLGARYQRLHGNPKPYPPNTNPHTRIPSSTLSTLTPPQPTPKPPPSTLHPPPYTLQPCTLHSKPRTPAPTEVPRSNEAPPPP